MPFNWKPLWNRLEIGISHGALLGGLLIFLTLIGIPSQDSEALAGGAVLLFSLLAIFLGWRTARRYDVNNLRDIVANLVVMGIVANLLFVPFMGIINNWHANDIDVVGLYFARMGTFSMHTLSGVPNEELFDNPPPNPVTGEYDEGVELRTNPMTLYFSEEYAVYSFFGFHIGGIYGLGLGILLMGLLGGGLQNGFTRVDWSQLNKRLAEQLHQSPRLEHNLQFLRHWGIMLLPLLFFTLFWISVPQNLSGGVFESLGIASDEPFQIVDFDDLFNLTSQSLIDGRIIQLGLSFALFIAGIISVRTARMQPSQLPYAVRFGFSALVILAIYALAIWRITLSQTYFIAPSISLFGWQSQEWSLALATLIAAGTLVFAALNHRDRTAYEFTFITTMIIGLVLIVPLFMNTYQGLITARVALMIMFGLGMNIVVGYAGLLDLGYVAFFAIGAYTFAFIAPENSVAKIDRLQLNHLGWMLIVGMIVAPLIIFGANWLWQQIRGDQPRLAESKESQITKMPPVWRNQPPPILAAAMVVAAIVTTFGVKAALESAGIFNVWEFSSFFVAIIISMLTAAFAGFLLGIPVLRLRGDYLAIVTLGFGEIISLYSKNWDDVTGGPSGALRIPQPVPENTPALTTTLVMVYLAFIGSGLVMLLSSRLRHSRLGRAWLAVRSDEDIAQAAGINLVNAKLLAFSIGASFAGLAGMLFASQQNAGVFPQDFTLERSIDVLSLVIIGGFGSIPGVVVGSIALIGLPELLRPVQDYRIMAFGLLLVLTMLFRPEGLMPLPPPSLEDEARKIASENRDEESA